MRIEIKNPAFKSHRLSVETASFLTGPKLLLNGVVLKRKGGRYLVASDSGQELSIKVMYNFLDPIPRAMPKLIAGLIVSLVLPEPAAHGR
jgi:hypothetical protein